MPGWTMSSETWIEPSRPRRSAGDSVGPSGTPESSDALQPWQLFTLAGLIGATVVVFVSRGHSPAGIVLLSLTIFAAAVAGVAAWRTLGPLVMPEDPGATQILGGRTRAALEREKALVLRSIKELEFDRAMGKIADKDFNEMSARLRARAARLIRQLDAGSTYRDAIAKEIERRVARPATPPARAAAAAVVGADRGRPTATPSPSGTSGAQAELDEGGLDAAGPSRAADTPTVKCAHCGTENDSDAQFCKRCGASLEPSE
jgi:hypothetical protein